ncbi:MAG TPA: hypothetical protein PK916_17885 [Bacteroidota bacterium]|nr:hypothetical protein [Bacteroidota bacterium]
MEHRNASQHGSRGSVSLLPLIVLLAFIGCSNQSPYDEALELIKQKKYDEAKEVLNTIPMGDSLAEKAKLGLMVCEIGNLFEKKDYSSALRIIDSGVVKEDSRFYVLNYPPTDELYTHVATLSILVYGNIAGKQIQTYLESEVNLDNLQWYSGTNQDPELLWAGVMKTYSEEEHYTEEDIDAYYGGTLTDPPFIRSIKLDKLNTPEEWRAEVDEMRTRMENLLQKISAKKREYELFEESIASLDGDRFHSVGHAMKWLTAGTGGWMSLGTRYNSEYGVDTRSVIIFKSSYSDSDGEMVIGNVHATTGDDVGRISEGSFRIPYTEGNTVHLSVGDVGQEGTMRRVSADRAIFGGSIEMRRVTKD